MVTPEAKKRLSESVFVATPKQLAFPVLLIVLLSSLLFSDGEVVKNFLPDFQTCQAPVRPLFGHFIQREISRYFVTITTLKSFLV